MEDELRLRARMIGVGIWLSVLLLAAVSAWIVATWGDPHRGGLVAMVSGAAIVTAIIAMLPRERIVTSRWREPFCLGWSLSLVAFIAVAAGLDDGVRSPVVLLLFLTLVFAALSYPRVAVAIVSGASLLAVLALSQVSHHASNPTGPVYLVGLMVALALTGAMCIFQARMQEQIRSELQRASRADPLTGALNRLGFQERMEAELRRAAQDGRSVALVLLDFDGFKAVNDHFGHAAGDELLRWAAAAMNAALRPGDALGRLGGDEFAALLPGTDLAQARIVAERVGLAIASRAPASTGAAATEVDGISAEVLHHTADRRLYAAKQERGVARLSAAAS